MSIHNELSVIQKNLKAPKGQWNKFGSFGFRSCEDILEALKPHLGDCVLTLIDDIQAVGDRVYVKATATLSNGSDSISVAAFARESVTKKGMDESQLTGTASSYARKYALNGLFCIDDTKDADTMDNSASQPTNPASQALNQTVQNWADAINRGDYILSTAPVELHQMILPKLHKQQGA